MADQKKINGKVGSVLLAFVALAAVFGFEISDEQVNVAKNGAASVIGGGALLLAFGRDILAKITGGE